MLSTSSGEEMSSPQEIRLHERVAALEREIHLLQRRLRGLDRDRALPAAGELALLSCRVAGERAAFPLEDVEEVVAIPALTALPEAEPWVAGLLNLRGRSIPVIDVEARVARRAREPL